MADEWRNRGRMRGLRSRASVDMRTPIRAGGRKRAASSAGLDRGAASVPVFYYPSCRKGCEFSHCRRTNRADTSVSQGTWLFHVLLTVHHISDSFKMLFSSGNAKEHEPSPFPATCQAQEPRSPWHTGASPCPGSICPIPTLPRASEPFCMPFPHLRCLPFPSFLLLGPALLPPPWDTVGQGVPHSSHIPSS